MPTGLDLIALAMKDAGVLGIGQTMNAEDTNDGFSTLLMMLDQWQTEKWLTYRESDTSFVSTGASSYTIGSGGTVDVLRPSKIESAFVRQLSTGSFPVDTPLEILNSREDYNRIASKNIGSYPTAIFYDANFPLGTLYVWPVPAASIYEIHMSLMGEFSRPTLISDDLAFPPAYMFAIRLNLAVFFRTLYRKPMDPQLSRLAAGALATVRRANTQMPRLEMPDALVNRMGRFNIYSGQ